MLQTAVDLLSEGRDLSTGNVGDLLQTTATTSNHMPHKVFGDNQRGKEAVGQKLPRVVDQEGSCNRFGGCHRGRSRAPSEVALLDSGRGDSLALGGFNHGWRGDAIKRGKSGFNCDKQR